MKKILILLTWLLFIYSGFAQNKYLSFNEGLKVDAVDGITLPVRSFENINSTEVEIAYEFAGVYISEKKVKKTTYNFLHIDGFAKMIQVGAPAVPSYSDIIAIPRGSKGKVVILNADYQEYSGYMIHPALEPAMDTEGAPSPKFEKDPKIYSADEFFPKNIVEITNTGVSRSTPLVFAEIRPVQFNPVTGKIRVYTNIKYKIISQGGNNNFDYISEENSLHYTNMLKRQVINSESIPDGIYFDDQKESKNGEKNYIIITHSQYLAQANLLANWKRQLGYSVEVVSQDSWTAEQVKTEVHNRYSSWTPKPDYFVIIGDHTGAYAVPGEIHTDPNYGDSFATDLYVACMDGTYDYIPDIAHGRISVSSSSEAVVVINKIIDYEKTPSTNAGYYTNILNCAQYQDVENTEPPDGYASRRFCHTSEEIRDYLQDNYSYNSTRVYKTETSWDVTDLHYNNGGFSDGQLLPAELRSTSFNWNGNSSQITSAINSGKFLVFHRDHGYVGGSGWHLPFYTTNTMTNLSNGDMLPVVFSMNCHTGEFQLPNCFAEKFIRMNNKGAVGVFAAAYYSYSGYNDALSEGFIDAIWSNPGLHPDFGSYGNGGSYTNGVGNDMYAMGDVLNQGLYAMVQNYGSNRYTFELFHYFGDPAMKIHTANPNNNVITASHNSTISCGVTSFDISGSAANALATLVSGDELIAETFLNGSGAGTLTFSSGSLNPTVTLTISEHNCKPYISDLTVTGVFPESPASVSATDTSICIGSSTVLSYTGGSGDTFEWYIGSCGETSVGTGNNITVSPTTTTTYYGRWENTCGYSDCEEIVITVNETTAITNQPDDVDANVGDNVSFTVVSAGENLSYQWRFNSSNISGADADTYSIDNVQESDAGDYDVIVNGDCGNETSDVAVLNVSVSVQDLVEYGISIYPNPSNGNFNIIFENSVKDAFYRISDMTGKVIYEDKLTESENIINLNSIPNGMYFIELNFDNQSVVSKIIIE